MQEQLETILRLAFIAEFRDADTSQHLRRISLVAGTIARQLGLADDLVDQLQLAAPMHDIGKVAIPDNILLKPGSLSAEERVEMQNHTVFGARLLAEGGTAILKMGEAVCLGHHERYDGLGYPHGLAGDEIPVEARIVALADVFDALVTRRVYKPAIPFEDAAATVREEAGMHFDPAVVEAFFACQDEIAAIYDEFGDDEGDWVT